MKSKSFLHVIGLILGLAILLGGSASSAGTSAIDPLVTLSYLTGSFTEQILDQADRLTEAMADEVRQDAEEQAQEIILAVESQSVSENPAGSYETDTLCNGDCIILAAGSEVLVISGLLTADTAVSDVTAGAMLASGSTLEANHLYICLQQTCMTAANDTVLLHK